MLLHQLVTINHEALVANAVSFELMNDPEKNLRLCEGFVFNYEADPKKLNASTVGVLHTVKQSFQSGAQPNIHLMVQDYGKGKSHFGLAIANFFQKPSDSPEVQGILKQIEYATGSDNPILESLKAYKKQGRNLVICLSGDKTINLKKQFLIALKKTLQAEGITESLGQKICELPLRYLAELSFEQREKAEAYLNSIGNPEGDLNMIMESLGQDNYQVIPRVKEISRLISGYALDFDGDIDVEEILSNVITKLCNGENARFQGVLILFDELYNYLQNWSNDPVGAGGTTLQGITNICERFKGKIALLSFSQRRLKTYMPLNYVEDYNRLSSRLELLNTTYEPAASLELVLNNLLVQQEQSAAWQEFDRRWRNYLTTLNTEIHQNRTVSFYQKRNWDGAKFFREVTFGCFPLHPLTVYLLCNLDFTQGRTAIQFVQTDVAEFIKEQSVEDNDRPNFIYPVTLVEAFKDNFQEANSSNYSDYRQAQDSIKASADKDEITVLQALFLYYASVSVSKLTKPAGEGHEKLLSLLTGMSDRRVASILNKLENERQVIYYNRADNAYRFFSGGVSIKDLRTRIEQEISGKKPAFYRVQEYCQQNLTLLGVSSQVTPQKFIEDNRLNDTDWKFKSQVYSVSDFRKSLNGPLPQGEEVGIVAYVIAETGEELSSLKREINQLLTPGPDDQKSIKSRVAVAIASKPAGEICKLLFMLETAKKKSVQELGAVLTQLQKQLDEEIKSKVKELFNACVYDSYLGDKVTVSDRLNPARVTSAILQNLFHSVAPQDKNDKMARKSTKGGEIISYVCKRLIEDNLRSQLFPQQAYRNLIEPVFVRSWRLVTLLDSKYAVQEPKQVNVKAAWDEISRLTALHGEGKITRTIEIGTIWEALSGPPYGYNEHTFTLLFVAWLVYHRSEISIKGPISITQKNQVSIVEKPLKEWIKSEETIFDKPKDFVQKWILHESKPKLIRSKPLTCPDVPDLLNYEQARKLIEDINTYLEKNPDINKVNNITEKRDQLSSGVNKIERKLEIIHQAQKLIGLEVENLDISELSSICDSLKEKFVPFKVDEITITFLPEKEKLRLETLELAIKKIEAIIDYKVGGIDAISRESECREYEIDIDRALDSIQYLDYLPPRFTQKLKDGLRVIKAKLIGIQERDKVDSALQEVEKLYGRLSSLATQSEYADTEGEIKEFAARLPALGDRESYRNILQDLKCKQESLMQKIADLEAESAQVTSLATAIQLNTKIHQDINRFTDENSKRRLDEIVIRLREIILRYETQEKESERIHDIITAAQKQLRETAESNNIPVVLSAYCDLTDLTFSDVTASKALNGEVGELEKIKFQGYKNVCTKLEEFFQQCQKPIDQSSDYEKYRNFLHRAEELVNSNEGFEDFQASLQEAKENLERQYQEFQKLGEDEQKINLIRQSNIQNANSIYICEEEIIKIEGLKQQLHYPDRYAVEIDNLLQKYHQNIHEYKSRLQAIEERLRTITDIKDINKLKPEYERLDFIFKDSSEYPHYQHLRTLIESVTQDLEIVVRCETLVKQSRSIAECTSLITTIAGEKGNLHAPERYRDQIEQLEAKLREKIQGYVSELNNYENNLPTVRTVKEAEKLQRDIISRSNYYRESEEETRYELLCQEINSLVTLLSILSNSKTDTLQSCQIERERLQKWRSEAGEITPRLESRFNGIIAHLDQTQEQIENHQRNMALQWLVYTEGQVHGLQFTEAIDKLDKANELLGKIKKEQTQYQRYFSVEQQQKLEEIINACLEIQNQDKESQIITLFQELPRDKRQRLLDKLSQYLLSGGGGF